MLLILTQTQDCNKLLTLKRHCREFDISFLVFCVHDSFGYFKKRSQDLSVDLTLK